MRRILFLAILAASLLPFRGPAQAQATADQLNRLSLEALTARPAGGGGGGYSGRRYRPAYHPRYHSSYRRRSYARAGYAAVRRFPKSSRHGSARGGRTLHLAHNAYRGGPMMQRHGHVRPAIYHRPRHR